MQVETYPLVMNIAVATISVLPILVMLYLYKSKPPKYYGLFLWGVLLICYSGFVFGWLSDAIYLLNEAAVWNENEKKVRNEIVSNLKVWVYLFPAVTAAVGVNLISAYLTKEKPA